jgi:hypothetical protein
MSDLDALTEQFQRLLDGIRDKHTLEEWRFAYRKIVYAGAMKILHDFPELIVGPVPLARQSKKAAGPTRGEPTTIAGPGHPVVIAGQPPPYHPSAIGELLCVVLGTCPHQTT